jgi:hypothetical protein
MIRGMIAAGDEKGLSGFRELGVDLTTTASAASLYAESQTNLAAANKAVSLSQEKGNIADKVANCFIWGVDGVTFRSNWRFGAVNLWGVLSGCKVDQQRQLS